MLPNIRLLLNPTLRVLSYNIFYLLRILLYSCFLLKSHKDLNGRIKIRLNFFVSLSTVL